MAGMQYLGLSYPKSGRTWLRLMVGHILCVRVGADLREALNPPGNLIRWTHGGAEMVRRGQRIPRIQQAIRETEGMPLFLLTRSPEATLESAWHQASVRRGIFVGGLSAFLRDPDFGARFWKAWNADWLAALSDRRALLLRYEDLRERTHSELERLCEFLELDPTTSELEDAVAFGSFDNMRRMEEEQFFREASMRHRGRGISGFKTRSAGRKSALTKADRAYVSRIAGSLLS